MLKSIPQATATSAVLVAEVSMVDYLKTSAQ